MNLEEKKEQKKKMKAEEKVQTVGEAEEPCLATPRLPFKYFFFQNIYKREVV